MCVFTSKLGDLQRITRSALCRQYGARVYERLTRESRQVLRPDVHRVALMKW